MLKLPSAVALLRLFIPLLLLATAPEDVRASSSWQEVFRDDQHRVEIRLESVPVQLSGTLRPFTLAINGITAIQDPVNHEAVLLDGKALETDPGASGAFFARTGREKLELELLPEKKAFTITFPAIEQVLACQERICLRVTGKVSDLSLDGAPLKREGELFLSEIPVLSEQTEGTHFIELQGTGTEPSRLYNLSVQRHEFEGSRDQFVSFGPNSSAGNGAGWGGSWGRKIHANWRASVGLSWAGWDGKIDTGTEVETSVYVRARGGYLPFDVRTVGFDLKRAELGLVLGVDQVHHELTQVNADPLIQDQNTLRAGFFVREEPVRWKDAGVALTVEFLWFAGPAANNTRAALEFTYRLPSEWGSAPP